MNKQKVFCCERFKEEELDDIMCVYFDGDRDVMTTSIASEFVSCFVLNDIEYCPFCGKEIFYKEKDNAY